jgi:hypothetical protein
LSIDKQKLEKLQNLLKLVSEGLTREEFMAAFKSILDMILKIEQKNDARFSATLQDLQKQIEKSADHGKTVLEDLRIQFEMVIGSIIKEQKNEIKDMWAQIKEVSKKEGPAGGKGERGDSGTPGKDGSPDTPEEILNKLSGVLQIEDIKGLKESLEEAKTRTRIGGGGFSKIHLEGHFIDDETPVDSGDATNFDLSHTPSPTSSLKLYRNGQRLKIGASNDYTFSGRRITLVTILSAGEILTADYLV